VAGVPCFVVDGGYALSGAQEPEFFLPLFDIALNRPAAPVA
jgi:predicted DsbA family dithiol-disulfide isomerase